MSRGGALLVLFALLAGGGVGYAVRSGSGPLNVAPEPDDPVVTGEQRDGDPWAPIGGEEVYPPLPRGAAPPADAVSGRGRVTGTVRTVDGEPLAGVLVRAWLRMASKKQARARTGVPPEADLEETIRGMADRERFLREVRREAVTAEDGSYVITGLADQKYLLSAYLRGWSIARAGRGFRAFGPGDTCDFVARRVVEVEARVLLPDGTVPDRAGLWFESEGRRESVAWRPGDPTVLLGPGTWRGRVSAGESHEYELTVEDITISAEQGDRVLTFRLRPKPGITGRITNVGKVPERSFEVRYLRIGPEEAVDLEKLRRNGKEPAQRGPRAERGFGVFGIPDGRYAVGLIEDWRVVDMKTVEVEGDQVRVDLKAPPFDPTAYVTVSVEGPAGESLSEGSVASLFFTDDGSGVAAGSGALTGAGVFRVRHPEKKPEQTDKAGSYFLEVRSRSHGQRRFPYAGPSATSVTVRLEDPARLTIVLEGYDRKEYLGHTEIHLFRREHGQDVFQFCPGFRKLGLDGRQLYDPLAPGRWEIEVRSKHGGPFGCTIARASVDLASGEHTRTVPLPDLHTLTLLVPDAEKRTTYDVRSTAAGRHPFSQDHLRPKDGRVTVGPMLAGEYVVTERRSGQPDRTMTLKVARSAELPFRPE